MTNEDFPAPNREMAESVVERLTRLYGPTAVPGVSLSTGQPVAPRSADGTRSSGSQSGVLERLAARVTGKTRYKIRGEVARGGMGAILNVWDEDLRRNLAMKVALGHGGALAGSGTADIDPRLLARFLEEAQITGQLEHPGIVPVHELGCDSDGRAFFTMPLVQGRDFEAILELVDSGAEDWSTTRALGVLSRVCEAMSYAHVKGVVHRDLKPANVMVGRFGEVYVMDWGLARIRGNASQYAESSALAKPSPDDLDPPTEPVATDPRDGSGDGADRHGLYTMEGDIVGTPTYMAPEQARGDLAALDERTDVYSLGAMLYRLLSGTPPYVRRGAQEPASAVLHQLLAGPPPSLEKLAPHAPPELVAIATKAMEREKRRRYSNMGELAEDLRAFLENRVVQAYETGAIAETRKWVRRNKPLAAALVGVLLSLAAGLGTSLFQKRRADVNALRAQREARIAEEVNAFLNDDLLGALAPEAAGIDVTMREALGAAADRLEGRFVDEPLTEARLRSTIGTSYQRLGEFERARPHLERCVQLRSDVLGANAHDTLLARTGLARLLQNLGLHSEAESYYQSTLAAARESLGAEHPDALALETGLSIVWSSLGRFADARAQLEQTLATQQRVLPPDGAEIWDTANGLGGVLNQLSLYTESEELMREVLQNQRKYRGSRHPHTLNAMSNLGLSLTNNGKLQAAEQIYREVLEIHREVIGEEHPRTAGSIASLANVMLEQEKFQEAEELFLEALDIHRRTLGEEHPSTLLASGNLAAAYERQGKHSLALPLRQSTLESQRRLQGDDHPSTLLSMNNLAGAYRAQRRYDEAETLFRETIAVQRRVLGADHARTMSSLENLAGVLFARGENAEARSILRDVLDARRRTLGESHPDVAKSVYNLGMVAQSTGDTEMALGLFQETLRLARESGNENSSWVAALERVGEIQGQRADYAGAIVSYREALDMRRRLGEPDGERAAELLELIGSFMHQVQRSREAIPILEEAQALLGREAVGTEMDTQRVAYFLALALSAEGRYEESERYALGHFESMRAMHAENHANVARARRVLVELYTRWGRPEDADAWR